MGGPEVALGPQASGAERCIKALSITISICYPRKKAWLTRT